MSFKHKFYLVLNQKSLHLLQARVVSANTNTQHFSTNTRKEANTKKIQQCMQALLVLHYEFTPTMPHLQNKIQFLFLCFAIILSTALVWLLLNPQTTWQCHEPRTAKVSFGEVAKFDLVEVVKFISKCLIRPVTGYFVTLYPISQRTSQRGAVK